LGHGERAEAQGKGEEGRKYLADKVFLVFLFEKRKDWKTHSIFGREDNGVFWPNEHIENNALKKSM